ncbi:MAG: DUF2563 family protein [Mycobacterium sp.]|nr:DUF2563 family protein [Mycobacterium sp.]
MADQIMKVDTDQLRSGATGCTDAAVMALAGAETLAGKAPQAGIFGGFAEADSFHESVVASHTSHVDQLRGHHRSLTDIGDHGHAAAASFRSTDEAAGSSIAAAGARLEAL